MCLYKAECMVGLNRGGKQERNRPDDNRDVWADMQIRSIVQTWSWVQSE